LINVGRADAPLLFAEPSSVSFGVLRPGQNPVVVVKLTDAGGGAGTWTVSGIFATPRTITVPGNLQIAFADVVRTDAEEAGYVVLQRGDQVRRIPYWFRVATPTLPGPARALTRTGTYTGSTLGKPSRVQEYRYPVVANGRQLGPEQVFRFTLNRNVANFGVAVLRGGVQPRVVQAGDENRLVGIAGLPFNINPYVDEYGDARPIAGAIRPAPRAYDIVFDSRSKGDRFAFRFWVDDVRPPTARLLAATAQRSAVRVRVADAGAGVDPSSLEATVDGRARTVKLAKGVASVDLKGVARGPHSLVFTVSDYQEAKNMENVALILPNTRVLRATIRVP
jgi:hypothetical protein